MDTNRIDSITHQIRGGLKEKFGKLIGDAKLEADGAAERAIGDAQKIAGGQLVAGVDADRISGVGRQLKGAGEQALGHLLGDAKLVADGSADVHAGRAQNAAGSARDEARQAGKAGQSPVGAAAVVVPEHDAPSA